MKKNINDYFDNIIMPLIQNRHNDILPEASIMILGSVGLGINDELSDMESVIYLPQTIWEQYGAQLQLDLNKCVLETNPWRQTGSVICVHPLSWVLDHQGEKILSNYNEIPWDKLSFESLFTIQKNLIIYDPQKRLSRIKAMTAMEKMPESFWNKVLLLTLKDFVENSFDDLRKSINRNNWLTEAPIHLGRAVENLFHIGFYICRQYYPWKTHLRWAFNGLPLCLSKLGEKFDLLSTTIDWHQKLNILEEIFTVYKEYIVTNSIFTEINFHNIDLHSYDFHDELVWAERLKAWENPNWKDFITERTEKALRHGYPQDQFWVWSLWDLE